LLLACRPLRRTRDHDDVDVSTLEPVGATG
jgi:hypothetical protein